MKQKWSKILIVRQIKKLSRTGVDISASNVSRNYIPLFTAASSKRYFHSWRKAVQKCGINYDRILERGRKRRREKLTKWDKKRVLKEIKALNPRGMSIAYRSNLALYSAARREYGNWKRALVAAGHKGAKRKRGRK